MDHRWGVVIEDQRDQSAAHISIPLGEMDKIWMTSLLDQPGYTVSMLEPLVHTSSALLQPHDIGWSRSLTGAVVEDAYLTIPSQIHRFNNSGFYSALQGCQPCNNLDPNRSGLAAFSNSLVRSTSCTKKGTYRNPTQREIHILSERQRREEMNEKLSMLRSILPRGTKKDKASTITDAIKHLTELEGKVMSLRSRKAIKEKQCKAENASPSVEKRTETRAENNRYIVAFSKQFGGDSEDVQSHKIEVQNLGTHAIFKILCPWSSRLLLRTHKALDECRVDVVQSIMTKHGDNAMHCFTIEFNPGTSSGIEKLMSALEEASSI